MSQAFDLPFQKIIADCNSRWKLCRYKFLYSKKCVEILNIFSKNAEENKNADK